VKIGMVGCGKLGLMVALAIESRGHEVCGYDVDRRIIGYLAGEKYPHKEEDFDRLVASSKMRMVELAELCDWADILFLAPQTPHQEIYEGHLPLPETRADFDYSYLKACVTEVNDCLVRPTTCVVISTVLPGTIDREVRPLLGENFGLLYEPLFIAMGTVVKDFFNPEFVLIGADDSEALYVRGPVAHSASIWHLKDFYHTIHDAPLFITDIKTAEGIKVFYNTFITTKTVLANLYGEMAEKLGMDVDHIYQALSMATDRLLSPKYLQAGMGDGGGCHPRDNIALSFIARQTGVSFDFFTALMTAREKHAEWQADLIQQYRGDLPVFILGRAFKPETNITTGSPSLLLSNILQARGIYHHWVEDCDLVTPRCYFIGTQHERYKSYKFPAGSVVIDPFRYLPEQDDVTLIHIGKHDTHRNYRTLQPAD
jgi:UDPglucose 6-dehydrogenase